MLASTRTSGAELDAVLVLPKVSAMPAASLRTAVASFNDQVWKLRLHGRDCSIRASLTDDGRLRVSAEVGGTRVGSCRVRLRPVTNLREVWTALEQEGGRRLPSTAVGRNGHFAFRLGKWSLAIMASILMLLPLLYVRRVENPGTLPAPAPLPAPIAAPVPGPVAKRPRPALAPRPIPAPTPKPDLPAPAPLPKPAATFVLRCPNSPSKRCSERLEAAAKTLAGLGFTGEVQMKDCNERVDLRAVIAPHYPSKYEVEHTLYEVENTLLRECDL